MKTYLFCMIVLILFLFSESECLAQNPFYISPGIRIGHQSNIGFSLSVKMSFGAFKQVGTCLGFINLTIGRKISGKREIYQNITFLKIQGGIPFINGGWGIGRADSNDGIFRVKISSFSTGAFVYWEAEHIMRSDGKKFRDTGVIGVVPVPFELAKGGSWD